MTEYVIHGFGNTGKGAEAVTFWQNLDIFHSLENRILESHKISPNPTVLKLLADTFIIHRKIERRVRALSFIKLERSVLHHFTATGFDLTSFWVKNRNFWHGLWHNIGNGLFTVSFDELCIRLLNFPHTRRYHKRFCWVCRRLYTE